MTTKIITVPKVETIFMGRSYWVHKDDARFALGLEIYSRGNTFDAFKGMCRRLEINLLVFKSGDSDKNEQFLLIDRGVWKGAAEA